jgi:hypothetical protein
MGYVREVIEQGSAVTGGHGGTAVLAHDGRPE